MLATANRDSERADGDFNKHGSPIFPQADLPRTVLVLTNRPTLGRRYDGLAVATRALGSDLAALTSA